MSFNQTMFNREPFNLSDSGNAQWLDVEAYETVEAYTGVSKNIFLLCIPHEKVTINLHGTPFKSLNTEAHEYIGYILALEGTFWKDCIFNESIRNKVFPSCEVRLVLSPKEITSNEASISSELRIPAQGSETLGETIIGSREYHTSLEGNELISQVTSAVTIEENSCLINVTLQPGEHLIVDANNYNVLINGKNFIHAQVGDWIDEITRNTYSITLTAASGGNGLSAHILYTERYL